LARKILLADDSVTAQNMGRRILSDAGYDVTTVNNGSAALKKIAESKPDLIVLDVYMPGYGGLEVCQRLREAPETARIPVLLTVGKLEPFKADEARRVRADAFIVKPFEASELLTALTKLEDKIVPQAQPPKPGRFAKALAAADDFATGKDFGNSETGWKNRLSIPPPHSKVRESEPEERPAAVASVNDAARSEEHQPAEMKSGLEEALLSSLPQDVTEEEIAAIKAAAAAFSAPGDASTPRMRRVGDRPEATTHEFDAKAEELPQESVVSIENRAAAATFASASEERVEEAPENAAAVAQAEPAARVEETTAVESVASVDGPGEVVAQAAAIVSESPALGESQDRTAESKNLADEEVTAALASLAPSKGNGDAAAIDGETAKWGFAARDRFSVTMAAAIGAQEFNGPRWIAESVSVMEDEATLILEQEMERAYASFAAADAARMTFASSPTEPEVSSPVAETPTANPEIAFAPTESSSNSNGDESKPPESTVQTSVEAEVSAQAASPMEAVSEIAVAEVKESSAYAAAASAGASMTEATMAAEAVSQPSARVESSDNIPPAPEPSEPRGESELAAAWANWRHIRESVIGSQLTSQIADTVAELTPSATEGQPDSQPEGSAASGEESNEISNIVDSVLADLKPKLMAEIAKKMGKEKKK
jgi:CheY-like chemotaxis protein